MLNRREALDNYAFSAANQALLSDDTHRFRLVCHIDFKTHLFAYRLCMPMNKGNFDSIVTQIRDIDDTDSVKGFI